MKKTPLLIALCFAIAGLNAQPIVGSWAGALEVQGIKLRLVFHISETDGVYTTLMDSPDQGAIGMKIPSTAYENNELIISMPAIGLTYRGALPDDGQTIAGTFGQGGFSTSLDLTNPQSKVKVYPKLNHLFQHCDTGNPANYFTIEETISPEVLRDITLFIQNLR